MNKKLIMYVYNDITIDARVQRAAEALASEFELSLISTESGKKIKDNGYKNILVKKYFHGALGIMVTILSALQIIRRLQPDVVYCHDFYSAILVYLLIKTHYSGKIIYDAHELIIPEEGRKNKRLNFFYWFEKRVVKKVKLLICASKQRGDIMYKHYGLVEKPFVIPNVSQLSVNDDNKDVQCILESLNEFFDNPLPTIVYAGVVTNSRRINELLDAAISLSNRCKLLIIGNGEALQALKDKANMHQELKTAFTGTIPYYCLGSILIRCDIGFLYYPSDTLNNKYCASNKIYEYASVGLPILANENPTIVAELRKENIGIASNTIENGLRILLQSKDTFKHQCKVFTSNNSWGKYATELKDAIIRIS